MVLEAGNQSRRRGRGMDGFWRDWTDVDSGDDFGRLLCHQEARWKQPNALLSIQNNAVKLFNDDRGNGQKGDGWSRRKTPVQVVVKVVDDKVRARYGGTGGFEMGLGLESKKVEMEWRAKLKSACSPVEWLSGNGSSDNEDRYHVDARRVTQMRLL